MYNGASVEVIQGDIVTFPVDAIVNAADINLRGGGGIDGMIHAAAGPGLLAELVARYPDSPAGVVGGAYPTLAHNIQTAQHIIHTVGPNWNLTAGNPTAKNLASELLYNAYWNSMEEALDSAARSIAFPTISTGVFGFPRAHATNIALNAVRDYLDDGNLWFDRVVFLVFGQADLDAYNALFQWVYVVEYLDRIANENLATRFPGLMKKTKENPMRKNNLKMEMKRQ
jgi:O-acetyl-ADP-ribose deacetylase (regulator of RNase III)